MTLKAAAIVDRLERFGKAFSGIASVATEADARWKPPSGAWSILEIVSHLADEEVDDFRTRVRLTQEDPAAPWPGIDPEGRARERKYNERVLRESVDRFVRERAESVAWLRSLIASGKADWKVEHLHPRFGPISAGTLLISWAAHDSLHMRQIAKRLYELAGRDGGADGFKTAYAGDWGG